MNTGDAVARSTTRARYISREPSRSIPCSTSRRRTTRPSGPVWCVCSVVPSMALAICLDVLGGARELHPARLAAAAGVDLRLHHHREAQLLGRLDRLVDAVGHLALGHGHAVGGEDRLALVLVDLHLGSASRPREDVRGHGVAASFDARNVRS